MFYLHDKVSGCARYAVRIIPKQRPDVSGMVVRIRPKYAPYDDDYSQVAEEQYS